jgi:hypothetical protein
MIVVAVPALLASAVSLGARGARGRHGQGPARSSGPVDYSRYLPADVPDPPDRDPDDAVSPASAAARSSTPPT